MHSTVASIQNIRKQRQLELELVELDRRWHVELKIIARERLGLVKELCRINHDLRHLDHFSEHMHGKDLTRFTDKAQDRKIHEKESKLFKKYDFEPDPVEKMNLTTLPMIVRENFDDIDGNGDDFGGDRGSNHGIGYLERGINNRNGHADRGSNHGSDFHGSHFHGYFHDRHGHRGGHGHGGHQGDDLGKVLTARDLNKQRIQLQKLNTEKSLMDRRNKRRSFWDKSIIGEKKQSMNANRQRNGFFGLVGSFAPDANGGLGVDSVTEDKPRKVRGPFKSPSLPALNKLHRFAAVKTGIHPSLSNKHSASMDYLPVIRGTKPNHAMFTSSKASLSSGSTLPTITEV